MLRNRKGYGNKNRIFMQHHQGYAGQITGGAGGVGADVDIVTGHVYSPCKVMTELIRVYGTISAGGSSVVKLWAGATAGAGTLVGSGTISDSVKTILMTLSNPGKVWPADQEFCISHATTNTETLDQLEVEHVCREYEA